MEIIEQIDDVSYRIIKLDMAVRATSPLIQTASDLGLDFVIKFPYIVFSNEQDFTTIQFFV